jgi:hypothetical protein
MAPSAWTRSIALVNWSRRSADDQNVARVHGGLKIANGLQLEDDDLLRRRACRWWVELS